MTTITSTLHAELCTVHILICGSAIIKMKNYLENFVGKIKTYLLV
jgi:hypothetical protein